MQKLTALLVLLVCVTAARAAESSAPDLYAAGKYEDAIAAGTAQHNADGYVIAARAALADALLRAAPCLDCFKRVEQFARRAAAANPKNSDAHVYVAVALGYQARIIGIVQARVDGDAEIAKKELDTALTLDPNNALALAALGGWNIEIVRHAGATLGNMLYGARVSDGQADFARAFAIAPEKLVLHFQYALSLSGYDLDHYRGDVERELSLAAKGIPVTAYDKATRTRAVELMSVLQSGDRKAYDALVRRYQVYP
jgi:hypothetical protein